MLVLSANNDVQHGCDSYISLFGVVPIPFPILKVSLGATRNSDTATETGKRPDLPPTTDNGLSTTYYTLPTPLELTL